MFTITDNYTHYRTATEKPTAVAVGASPLPIAIIVPHNFKARESHDCVHLSLSPNCVLQFVDFTCKLCCWMNNLGTYEPENVHYTSNKYTEKHAVDPNIWLSCNLCRKLLILFRAQYTESKTNNSHFGLPFFRLWFWHVTNSSLSLLRTVPPPLDSSISFFVRLTSFYSLCPRFHFHFCTQTPQIAEYWREPARSSIETFACSLTVSLVMSLVMKSQLELTWNEYNYNNYK